MVRVVPRGYTGKCTDYDYPWKLINFDTMYWKLSRLIAFRFIGISNSLLNPNLYKYEMPNKKIFEGKNMVDISYNLTFIKLSIFTF